jgi:hypothetical protein
MGYFAYGIGVTAGSVTLGNRFAGDRIRTMCDAFDRSGIMKGVFERGMEVLMRSGGRGVG